MNTQYTATIYLILFALFIMILIVRNNDSLDKKKKTEFITIFTVIMISAATEWLANWIDGRGAEWRFWNILTRATEHSLAPAIAVVFMNILSEKEKAVKMIPLLIIHGILEYLSGIWGVIYYVDAQGKYYHGDYYGIYIAFYLFCAVYFLIAVAGFSKKYQSTNRFILELAFLFLFNGIVLRLVNSSIHVDYLSVSMDAVIMYIYYMEIVEKTDSITLLLNRRSYESYLFRIHEPAVILYFDVDDFKNINDQYGHHIGDFCLKEVGKCLQQVYASNGHCYRIGGDEFCVLLEKKISSVKEMNQLFQEKLEDLRGKDERIPYVSIGYVFFNPEKTDIESAIKEADAQMYRGKQANKTARKSGQEVRT